VTLLEYESSADLIRQEPLTLLRRHVSRSERGTALRSLGQIFRGALQHVEQERKFVTQKGREVTVYLYYDAIVFDDIPCVMLTLRDVTQERVMHEKLSRAERMASVGTLAAGVAHEINNPLAYVTTNIAYCAERLRYIEELLDGKSVRIGSPESLKGLLRPMAQALAEAHQGTTRVATIVRDLRALTRDDAELKSEVDLESALESAIHMAESEFRYKATLLKHFSNIGTVKGNETRLVQVFVNLLVNAAQAFHNELPENNRIIVRAWHEQNATYCEFEDNGIGIPPENIERIFLPFFTTKPVGVGTGLGLSICHGLVESMGGAITVDSEPGKGTTFRVRLETSDNPLPVSTRRVHSVVPVGRARVLLVDDEPLILRSVARLLRDQHDVETASNGREALDRLTAGEHFDLIVCDLMMPVMTGMELFAAVQKLGGTLSDRFVFLTGGAFTETARRFLATVPNPTLDKPVQPNLLRSVVSSVLSGQA
jgi:two-component system, cell cycle sensor histidine kinase and response regulator CckA